MPVKRRNPKARHLQITAEMVQLFRDCTEIQATVGGDAWESEGGRHREFLDKAQTLRRAFKLPPWAICPTDPGLEGEMPDYMRAGGLCSAETWEPVKEIRAELKKLARRRV